MAYLKSTAIAVIALCALLCVSAELDLHRVWLVDQSEPSSGANNFLFRGNMPTNDTDKDHPFFAYHTLLDYMHIKAALKGATVPDDVYMIDVSLNNPFDGPDFWAEEAFWKNASNADLGRFINWPLGLAGILPPSVYPLAKRLEMANSSVWKFDQIPTRIATLRTLLNTKMDKPVVIYVHCTAGCDRTGEVIGSYRLTYQTQNLTKMYEEDTTECGRSPNYWSTSALEWFCYYYMDQHHDEDIGNCLGFADCKPFGSCHPTGSNLEEQGDVKSSYFHSMLEGLMRTKHTEKDIETFQNAMLQRN